MRFRNSPENRQRTAFKGQQLQSICDDFYFQTVSIRFVVAIEDHVYVVPCGWLVCHVLNDLNSEVVSFTIRGNPSGMRRRVQRNDRVLIQSDTMQ